MKNVKILDCTLRDGGRIIDCDFGDKSIINISYGLTDAKIDIVEMGFLRSGIDYKQGSTFFTDVNQIKPFIKKDDHTKHVVFTDVGMFDYETLPMFDGKSIDGVRVGFTKSRLNEATEAMQLVKEKGYLLFVQAVNTLGYSEQELAEIIKAANKLVPYSFGIVDTYGAMYADDVKHFFDVVNELLDLSVNIDFHSHNNYQMSFALAQEMIKLCENKRGLIIDSSLYGMGKVAGNLNTELIVDFLIRKYQAGYELDTLLDLIDEELLVHYNKNFWGYSVPALMSGVYQAHPNNVIYLTNKFRLDAKDIKSILDMLDESKRQTYDYDTIDRLYAEYSSVHIDDHTEISRLKSKFKSRDILLLAPGKSILEYADTIRAYIEEKNPVLISLNFESKYESADNFVFFNSKKKYEAALPLRGTTQVIIPSNVKPVTNSEIVVNYASLVERTCKHFDNAAIMAMRLIKRFDISSLVVAGLDGFSPTEKNYSEETAVSDNRYLSKSEEINADIAAMLASYVKGVEGQFPVRFLTPSRFESAIRLNKDHAGALRYLVMDVDGTLTDGSINIAENGECYKRFDVKDGYGIVMLKKAGITPLILTGRASTIVEERARELGIEYVYQNVKDKRVELEGILKEVQCEWKNVAYIGDDLNDIDCMKRAVISACPNDAVRKVKESVSYICNSKGGNGAVREFCEYLLAERTKTE